MSNPTDPVQQAYNQYNTDVNQWQTDCTSEVYFANQWKSLIAQLGSLLAAGKVQEAFSIVQYQLLGPTIVDGYEQSFQNVQGDIMNITSDIRALFNRAQEIFNKSDPGTSGAFGNKLTPTEQNQFAEALNDLYTIFSTQQGLQTDTPWDSKPDSSPWLDPNDCSNALQSISQLFGAFGKDPTKGKLISAGDAGLMYKFWPTQYKTGPNIPNPGLTALQDGFQSLASVDNSPSQSAQTQASYMAQSANTIEGAQKDIFGSMAKCEGVEVQNQRAQ